MNDNGMKKVTASVEKSLRKSGFLPGGTGILVALSGGADSVMLFFAVKSLSAIYHFTVEAVHVNHMIRGNEAARDEDFCRMLCARSGIKCHIIVENIPKIAIERGTGLEETARQIRYDVFRRLLEQNPKLTYVVTAHNATDNVETVLFHMARGCGLRGLCGIPEARGKVLRPLLSVSKETITESLREAEISFVEDSTNSDTRYTRNYIRHEMLPLFRKLNQNVDSSVSRMCAHLTDDLSYIEQSAKEWAQQNGVVTKISVRQLSELHPAIAGRIVAMMYRNAGGQEMPEEVHIEPLLTMIRSGSNTFIHRFPGGICAYVEHGRVVFSAQTPFREQSLPEPQKIHMGENVLSGRSAVLILSRDPHYLKDIPLNIYKTAIKADISSAKIEGSLYIRKRSEGDAYRYGGMTHKIKKLFADYRLKGIPNEQIPVLCDDRGIVWVPGFAAREDVQKSENQALYAYYCYRGGENE